MSTQPLPSVKAGALAEVDDIAKPRRSAGLEGGLSPDQRRKSSKKLFTHFSRENTPSRKEAASVDDQLSSPAVGARLSLASRENFVHRTSFQDLPSPVVRLRPSVDQPRSVLEAIRNSRKWRFDRASSRESSSPDRNYRDNHNARPDRDVGLDRNLRPNFAVSPIAETEPIDLPMEALKSPKEGLEELLTSKGSIALLMRDLSSPRMTHSGADTETSFEQSRVPCAEDEPPSSPYPLPPYRTERQRRDSKVSEAIASTAQSSSIISEAESEKSKSSLSAGESADSSSNPCKITEPDVPALTDIDRARERFAMMDLMSEAVNSRRLPARIVSESNVSNDESFWNQRTDSMRLIWFDDSTETGGERRNSMSAIEADRDGPLHTKGAKKRTEDGDSSSELSKQRLSLPEIRASLSDWKGSMRLSMRNSFHLSRAKRNERFHFVAAAVRTPPLPHSSYGSKWSLDVFTLFHNAIRMEMKDMYTILTSIKRCLGCLVPENIKDFYLWFSAFRELVLRVFELQHLVILPRISAFLPLSNGLDENDITQHHRNVMAYLDKISRYENDFLVRRLEQSFVKLMMTVDDFSGCILHLFAVLEADLPDLVQSVNRQLTIENELRSHMKKWYRVLPLVVRPLNDTDRQEWLARNVKGKWKISWSHAMSSVERGHLRIVTKMVALQPDFEVDM